MFEYLANDCSVVDQRDDVHRRAALGTFKRMGAAYLAGLATGVWTSREEIAKQWKVAKRFEPKMKREEAERRMEEWKRALERARGWEKD